MTKTQDMAQFVSRQPTARALDYGCAGFIIRVTRAAYEVARTANENLDDVNHKVIVCCVVATREKLVLLGSCLS